MGAAREAGDQIGVAQAQETRARALQGLARTQEAISAWREARAVYARMADGPGQVRALAERGVFLTKPQPGEAESLFQQALALARAETKRPLAAAQALHTAGNTLFDHRDKDLGAPSLGGGPGASRTMGSRLPLRRPKPP